MANIWLKSKTTKNAFPKRRWARFKNYWFQTKKKGIPGPRTFAYVPDVVPYIFTQSIGRKTNSLGE
ncbi:hypothetical protein IC575_020459 [Cucumis melo]